MLKKVQNEVRVSKT